MQDRTNKELEALSAYLDGQLPDKQRIKLEARLAADADLQAALDGLRRTRTLLRRAPQAKAPRNFTLTPDMVAAPVKFPRLYAPMRLVSVLASFLFVVVIFADVLTGAGDQPVFSTAADFADTAGADAGAMPAAESALDALPQAAPESEDLETAELGETAADDSVADSAAEPAEESLRAASTPALGTPTAVIAGPTAAFAEAPAEDTGAEADGGVAGDTADAGDAVIPDEPELLFTPPAGTATLKTALEDEQADEGSERALAPPAALDGDADATGEGGGAVQPAPPPFNIFLIFVRVVEIGLLVLALGAGLAALALRRKERG